MSLKATLGHNVHRLIHERAGRTGAKLCHVWTQLAREGWPDEANAANRAAYIKRVAQGKLWPGPENLARLAKVLEAKPWELLRP